VALEEMGLAQDELRSKDLNPDFVVHSVRKRLKRVRALLRLVRFELGPRFQPLNLQVRDAGRRLSELRDMHVVLAALDGARFARSHLLDASDRAALAVLEQDLARVRDERRARDGYRRTRLRVARELDPVMDAARKWRFRHKGFKAYRPGFERSYAQGRKAMHAALESGALGPKDIERFHEWRKRVKDHWHHCELLSPGYRPTMGRRADRVHLLSDALGAFQDLAVLEAGSRAARRRYGRRKGASSFEPVVERLISLERERLAELAAVLGRGIYRRQPERFGSQVAHRWGA
jgi:CHAD domain-containing protein